MGSNNTKDAVRMQHNDKQRRNLNLPKSLLDAADIVYIPVLPGDVFLADRDSGPSHAHLGDTIHIVLVKFNFECTEVVTGPLGQAPLLHDQSGSLEFHVFSIDIPVENGEFSTNVSAFKLTRCTTGERSNALRVSEGIVELLRSRAELIRGSDCRGIDRNLASSRCGGFAWRRSRLGSLGVIGRGCKTAGRVGARCVLDILPMLSDQGRRKLGQLRPKLRNDL